MKKKLPRSFYEQPNVVELAKSLIGCHLHSNINGAQCNGMIVETEAYRGWGDKACHAKNGITKRNSIMFRPGGFSYVYLCYGIHYLFNVVTNTSKQADAVLIRAIEPLDGIEVMKARRNIRSPKLKDLTSGPGKLSTAMGFDLRHNGIDLTANSIWITESNSTLDSEVIETKRIGVDYAGQDALLNWRFYLAKSMFVSKK